MALHGRRAVEIEDWDNHFSEDELEDEGFDNEAGYTNAIEAIDTDNFSNFMDALVQISHINFIPENQTKPLLHHIVIKNRVGMFDGLIADADIEITEVVNCKDTQTGDTALHRAAQLGHVEMAKKLLELGASINTTNNDKCTPAYIAAKNFGETQEQCFSEIHKLFISAQTKKDSKQFKAIAAAQIAHSLKKPPQHKTQTESSDSCFSSLSACCHVLWACSRPPKKPSQMTEDLQELLQGEEGKEVVCGT